MSRQGDKQEDVIRRQDGQEPGKPAPLNETWSQDAQAELEDFIEQQGIYIRQ